MAAIAGLLVESAAAQSALDQMDRHCAPPTDPAVIAGMREKFPTKYPPDSCLGGCPEGEVVLDVEVGSNGDVKSLLVKKSSGRRVLDQAAIATVKRWQFVTATQCGRNVVGRIDVPISFRVVDDTHLPR